MSTQTNPSILRLPLAKRTPCPNGVRGPRYTPRRYQCPVVVVRGKTLLIYSPC